MAVPYMGSKRKSAGMIYQTIKNLEPDSRLLADLFCGGFAISEYFIKNGWSVIANDKNKYVIELIRETINGRFNDDVFTPEFITREEFESVTKEPSDYDGWYVGYIQCVWSFGNSQNGYMFGKTTEPFKRAGHELVVNKDRELIDKLNIIPDKYVKGVLGQDNWHKRRVALNMVARKLKNRIFELERLGQLQQLERLEQLQQLEQLERLEQLELYSVDYKEVPIPDNAVIYCDPPYVGTGEYSEKGFNHNEFWDWVRMKSKTHSVYVSEYKAPNDFKTVLRFPQKSTMAGGVNKGQPDEKLFKIKL